VQRHTERERDQLVQAHARQIARNAVDLHTEKERGERMEEALRNCKSLLERCGVAYLALLRSSVRPAWVYELEDSLVREVCALRILEHFRKSFWVSGFVREGSGGNEWRRPSETAGVC
jgi:hypothetical protein